ncbi:stage VI sporulation protein F [Aquibacillus rhizosphaerae]|uniref:Stage VI sporulation protein F n=1 Tax=Aquibacillus rhizosphaerae TaxID=3051431 RepID=A0ABT7L2T3_9BACI|nr:stage VI sporulation protein F [Aquibacillus sp. LR5S19]MDL4839527.1 stage VI sporulation protein F [Aquibacillus sp. LR5S19]
MPNMRRKLEYKLGIPMDNISKLAKTFSETDMSDEKRTRQFAKQVRRQTGLAIPREMEDFIIRKMVNRRR